MPSAAGARLRSLRFCRSERLLILSGHQALSNTSCTALVLQACPPPAPGVRGVQPSPSWLTQTHVRMGGQSGTEVGGKAVRKRGTQFRAQREASEGLTGLTHLGERRVTLVP